MLKLDDIYFLGVNKDYIPPSPSFNLDTFNDRLEVDKDISSLTKISCCTSGCIEDIFKSLNTTYAAVHLSIEIRVDYMCLDSNMNFHKFKIDKIIYINIGSNLNTRLLNIDTQLIDIGVLSINKNVIDLYILVATSLFC